MSKAMDKLGAAAEAFGECAQLLADAIAAVVDEAEASNRKVSAPMDQDTVTHYLEQYGFDLSDRDSDGEDDPVIYAAGPLSEWSELLRHVPAPERPAPTVRLAPGEVDPVTAGSVAAPRVIGTPLEPAIYNAVARLMNGEGRPAVWQAFDPEDIHELITTVEDELKKGVR